MTITVVVMIIIGIIICVASFFVSEKLSNKGDNLHLDLMMVDDDYEFSERELRIIRRKIEDVIANQAKDILYETNESLANMANEKTMALGDYAVAVCEQIEKNHKEVMFLYSMLDDKQKDIMKTVRICNDANKEAKDLLDDVKRYDAQRIHNTITPSRPSALDQLTALSQKKQDIAVPTVDEPNKLDNAGQVSKQADNTDAIVESTHESEQLVMENSELAEEISDDAEAAMDDLLATDLESVEDVFAELDQTDINFDDVLEAEFEENENSNDIILEMYRNGSSVLEIAKQLGLGVGEVKLVIDLYQGE